jgi:predicted alpha/beta superfamily hydrolase
MLGFLYRWLLRLHPPRFRQRFAGEMFLIFDGETRTSERAKLLTDGLLSLARQWVLRSEFWHDNGTAPAHSGADGVPAFYTFENFKPRTSALVDGGMLSVVLFFAICLVLKYNWTHPVTIPFTRPQFDTYSDTNHSPTGAPKEVASAVQPVLSPPKTAVSLSIIRTQDAIDGFATIAVPVAPADSAVPISNSMPDVDSGGSGQAESPNSGVTASETVRILSNVLNESRSLTIAKPASYESGTERYPVVYLLDGEDNFVFTTAIVNFLSDKERIPEMIVVAINSGDPEHRTHDLTPPSQVEIENRFSPSNGGADAFLAFIGDELIPYIDKSYRTRPYKILVGHSFGGLFAIHALVTKPRLFNAYIAIDPTLSWNNEAEVVRSDMFFSNVKDLQADLFISAANSAGGVTPGVRRLVAVLDDKSPRGFRWNFEWLNEETHLSIPLRSIYSGLDYIFDGWHLADPMELFDKGGLDAIHRHFREGGKRSGYDRTTSAFTVSMIVAGLIGKGRLEEASTVLLEDPKTYPPRWNQLDALARAYAARGDVEQTIRFYRLSLGENPDNQWARQKLTELGVKSDSLPQAQPR